MRITILFALVCFLTQLDGNAKSESTKPKKFRELSGLHQGIKEQIVKDTRNNAKRGIATVSEKESQFLKKKKMAPKKKNKDINPALLESKASAFGKHLEGVYCDSSSIDVRTQSGGECSSRVLSF